MTTSTDTQLKLQIQNRVNRLKNTPKFEITKKIKYAITFQFQILSRNILLINMQEIVHNKGRVNTCPRLVVQRIICNPSLILFSYKHEKKKKEKRKKKNASTCNKSEIK